MSRGLNLPSSMGLNHSLKNNCFFSCLYAENNLCLELELENDILLFFNAKVAFFCYW